MIAACQDQLLFREMAGYEALLQKLMRGFQCFLTWRGQISSIFAWPNCKLLRSGTGKRSYTEEVSARSDGCWGAAGRLDCDLVETSASEWAKASIIAPEIG